MLGPPVVPAEVSLIVGTYGFLAFFLFLKVSVPGFELRVDYEDMARLCCFGAGCSDVSPTFDRFPRLFLGHGYTSISRIFVNYFCVSITNTTRY